MHKEYSRIIDSADTAVLFIHGIIGTPDHFVDFIPLVPENVSVFNMLLDGHGGTVEDFSHTSMEKWKNQVADKVEELSKTHSKIIIVAHSMGTLFAISEAVKHPQVISNLFLIASPLKVGLKPRMFTSATKIYFDIDDNDEHTKAARRAYGIDDRKSIYKYAGWIPRYKELMYEIIATRHKVQDVRVKTQVFQSADDELVSIKSIRYLEKNPDFEINMLLKSSHFYYDKDDYAFLLDAFTKIFG